MKRSFPVNICGRIYNIDEDAYQRLNQYFDHLRSVFKDDPEVADDIEARVAEHFDAAGSPNAVITLTDVNAVILTMGQPDELCDDNAAAEVKVDCGTNPPPYGNGTMPPPYRQGVQQGRRLFRDTNNSIIGGVLSGLAAYLGWDPTWVRIGFVALSLITGIWPLFVAYTLAWIIIPPANTPLRQFEMRGAPATVDNVGRTVVYQQDSSAGSSILNILGKMFMALVGFASGCMLLIMLYGFIMCLIGMFTLPFVHMATLSEMFDHSMFGYTQLGCLVGMLATLSFIIPCGALTWASCSVLFGAKGASRRLIITAVILEAALIVGTGVAISFLPWNMG